MSDEVRDGVAAVHVRPIEPVSSARVPTIYGEFRGHVFRDEVGVEHLALTMGDISSAGDPGGPPSRDTPEDRAPAVLARVHSECLTGDILASLRCDCGNQLHHALERIAEEGRGVVAYLRGHEGRGIGIGHKIAAYALQDEGVDTVDANLALGLPVDDRDFEIGARMLRALGVSSVRLLTNNPDKVARLREFGLEVVERVATESWPNPENIAYLRTKQMRMGHLIDGLDLHDAAGS